VRYLDTWWVDGGVLNNFPLEPIEALCDFLIGVNVNALEPQPPRLRLLDVVDRSFHLVMNRSVHEKAGRCDVFIEPPGMSRFNLFSLNNLDEIFDYGYRHALSMEKSIAACALKA
jgi:NTE family protein